MAQYNAVKMAQWKADNSFTPSASATSVASVSTVTPAVPVGCCSSAVTDLQAANQAAINAITSGMGTAAFNEWLQMDQDSNLCPNLKTYYDDKFSTIQASASQDGQDAEAQLTRLLLLDQAGGNTWNGDLNELRDHYTMLYN